MNSLAPHFHAKGLSVRLEAGPETYVCADAVRLEQIVTNLLTNALKYTESGTIAVSVVREGDAAAFRVSDTGIGIAPELLPSIFDLFTQEERSLARSEGGLGIGLSLVKGLVEIHGGTIAAESAGAGHGSTFTVRLPALQKAPPEEADPAEENPPGQRRILVVDDNADAAETLVDVLGAWGHIAEAVHDGEAALLKVAAVRPDIVLLDLGLPGIDGYEVARRLRSDPSLNDVLLVALTGYGHEEDRRRTRYVGFDYHFVKPMDFAALRRLVADPRASLPDGD